MDIYSEAVEVILATRDFCGDESEALGDFQNDNNVKFTNLEIQKIICAANNKWQDFQTQCGAKMLVGNERALAYAALNDDYLP